MSDVASHPLTDAPRSRAGRMARDRAFAAVCWVTAGVSVALLAVLLISIVSQGVEHLDVDFITSPPSRNPESAGLGPAMWGSVWICVVCAVVALPLGVGTAVFLEEYKPKSRFAKKLSGFAQLNIANLAGVPSIVYGIIGLTAFVQVFGAVGNPSDPGYAIGQQWFDVFAMADGSPARVRVEDREAPSLVAAGGLGYTDENGDPLTVRLVPEDEVLPTVYAIEDRMSVVKGAVTESIRRGESFVESDVAAAVDAAFDEAGLELDRSVVRPEVIAGLLELSGVTGREFGRGVRSVMSKVRTAETRAELPNVLVLGTEPTRVDKKRFYYMQLPLGRGVLAGGLTLMLVILPVVIISSQEALRAVPNSLREGAQGLGSTKWQMVSRLTLPAAVPGIMTGMILAMSRAIGEAAPILIIGGIVFIRFTPEHLMDEFTAMPLQIYDWAGRPQEAFHHVAASGIMVLLAVLLTFNAAAVFVRHKFQRPMQ